jgi:hypothetical protein
LSHQHAREIASRGFRVFEIHRDTKRPALKGWQDRAAKRDLSWWHGDSAVGIATGEYEPGRYLLVLDVDDKPDKQRDGYASFAALEAEHGPIPRTLTVETRSGGMHVYLWSPVPIANSVNKIGPGLDIRCAGGLVVAPGQLGYEELSEDFEAWQIPWAPDWLLALCKKAREKSEKAGQLLFEEEPPGAVQRATRLLMEAEPACEGAGGDDWTYRLANLVLDEGVTPATATALMIEHWNDRCQPPWSYEDIEQKVENAARYRKDAIGSKAVEADFEPAMEVDEITGGVLSEEEDEGALHIEHAPDVFFDVSAPETLKGVIGCGSVAMLYGAPNEGKTFVAMDFMAAVAKGEPWMGRKTRQGLCLHVAMEGEAGIKKRYMALQREKGASGLYLLTDLLALTSEKNKDVRRLIAAYLKLLKATGMQPGVICIDTVALAIGGDEDKTENVSPFLKAMKRIAKDTGATVLLLHHPGKDESRGPRGSSGFNGNVDQTLYMKGGRIYLKKVRDGAKDQVLGFALKVVEIGKDADGDAVTTCVVEQKGSVEEEFGEAAGDEKEGSAIFRRAAQRALDASNDKSKINGKMIFNFYNEELKATGGKPISERTFRRRDCSVVRLLADDCPGCYRKVPTVNEGYQWVRDQFVQADKRPHDFVRPDSPDSTL